MRILFINYCLFVVFRTPKIEKIDRMAGLQTIYLDKTIKQKIYWDQKNVYLPTPRKSQKFPIPKYKIDQTS